MPDEKARNKLQSDEGPFVQKLAAIIDDSTNEHYDSLEFITYFAGTVDALSDDSTFRNIAFIAEKFVKFEIDRNRRRLRRAAINLIKLSQLEPLLNVICKKIEFLVCIDGDLRNAERELVRLKLKGLRPSSAKYNEAKSRLLARNDESPLMPHWAAIATLREMLVCRAIRVVTWIIYPLREYLRSQGINVRGVITSCLSMSTRPGPSTYKRLRTILERLLEIRAQTKLSAEVGLVQHKESNKAPLVALSRRANRLKAYVSSYVQEHGQIPTYDDMQSGAEMARNTVAKAKRELINAKLWPTEKYRP